jgi:hypothetical protein
MFFNRCETRSATVRNSPATVRNSPQQSATVPNSPQQPRNSSQQSATVRNSPETAPKQSATVPNQSATACNSPATARNSRQQSATAAHRNSPKQPRRREIFFQSGVFFNTRSGLNRQKTSWTNFLDLWKGLRNRFGGCGSCRRPFANPSESLRMRKSKTWFCMKPPFDEVCAPVLRRHAVVESWVPPGGSSTTVL